MKPWDPCPECGYGEMYVCGRHTKETWHCNECDWTPK